MACEHVLIEAARMGLDDGIMLDLADVHDLLAECFGHDIHFAVILVFHDDVVFHGVECNREVAGKRPDRGCPDHEVELRLIEMRELSQIVVHRELDVHGRAGVVLIFDLSLGQRRLVVIAPVDGLEALVDVALFVHRAEDLDLFCLKARGHGLIRMLPVGDDAEALEAFHLDINIVLRKIVARGAELRDGHGLMVQLVLLDDGRFNRHAVVVPAGDIGGIVPAHGRRAVEEVLDALVERVAHVQRAVGERRAVMQREQGLAAVLLEKLVVKVEFFPVLEHIGLAHRKAASHREAGLRHV